MADIFLSYNRQDQAVAALYSQRLAEAGFTVWWDSHLKSGEAYDEVTEGALRAAKAVVVLWSPRSVVSRWVRAEATIADRCKTFVPVMIEPCERPIMFELTQTPDLSHWDGDADDGQWLAFLNDLREFVGRERVALPATTPKPKPPETLLAVLPFDNLSSDQEMEFFSDGVSEDILARISRGSMLKVIGRTSSFQFRGAEKSNAAKALGASHVLDGSIRRAGSKVRIAAHLTEAKHGTTLWSDKYDRDLEDIFAVQDEISEAIATELHSTFFPEPTAKIDPAAYDLYLRARAIFLRDLTWADRDECRNLLSQVVAIAPEFAPGWGLLAVYSHGSAAVSMADRGLALDPDNAVAMTAHAVASPAFADHRKKLEWSRRAYALDPDDQMVAGIHNVILMSLGYVAESLALSRRRFEFDPLSPIIASDLAMAYRTNGMGAEALAQAERAIAQFPDAPYCRFIRGVIAVYDNDMETLAGMAALPTADGSPNPLLPLQMLMGAVASMEGPMRTMAVGQFLQRGAPASYLVDIGLAGAMGEVDVAIEHLLAALAEGRPIGFALENEGRSVIAAATCSALFMPNFEELRRDPRFAEICVRLGLHESWQETGQWPDCVAEVAPYYDFKAECERIAGTVGRYRPVQPAHG